MVCNLEILHLETVRLRLNKTYIVDIQGAAIRYRIQERLMGQQARGLLPNGKAEDDESEEYFDNDDDYYDDDEEYYYDEEEYYDDEDERNNAQDDNAEKKNAFRKKEEK